MTMKTNLTRLRTFEVSYVPCTNYRPSRVKIIDLWYNETVIISYSHEHSYLSDTAIFYLESIGFNLVADSADQKRKVDLLLSDTWGPGTSLKEMIKSSKGGAK